MKLEMDPELRRKIEIEVRKQLDLAIKRTMDLTTDRPPGPAGLGTPTQEFLDWKLGDFNRDVLPYLVGPRLSSLGYSVPSYLKDEDYVLRFGGAWAQRHGNGYVFRMGYGSSGSYLVKMHLDGTLDESFGDKGLVPAGVANDVNEVGSVRILPDGSLLVIGYGLWSPAVRMARFSADGKFDATFGNGAGIIRFTRTQFAIETFGYYLNYVTFLGYTNKIQDDAVAEFWDKIYQDSQFDYEGFLVGLSKSNTSFSDFLKQYVALPASASQPDSSEMAAQSGADDRVSSATLLPFGIPTGSLASLLSQAVAAAPASPATITTQELTIAAETSALRFGSLVETGSSETDGSTGDLDDLSLPDGEFGPILEGTTRSKGIAPRITTPSDADVEALDLWWDRFSNQVATLWNTEDHEHPSSP
ncbi:MAG: hypothetical protein HZA46_19870 [Planctomycetales bacterium]|nr:hypothetical protein [Planctomycetales bacterium]